MKEVQEYFKQYDASRKKWNTKRDNVRNNKKEFYNLKNNIIPDKNMKIPMVKDSEVELIDPGENKKHIKNLLEKSMFKTADQFMKLKNDTKLIKSIHDGTYVHELKRPLPGPNENQDDDYPLRKINIGLMRNVKSRFIPPLSADNFVSKNIAIITPNQNKKLPMTPASYETRALARNVDESLIEMIENEIIDKNLNVSWEDIAGLEFVKSVIKEIIIWPMLRPDIFTGLRKPAKGILLFGPPGTGKTLIARCIASFCNNLSLPRAQKDSLDSTVPPVPSFESPNFNVEQEEDHTFTTAQKLDMKKTNMTFFNISSAVLLSKWVGESEKLVRALFETARKHAPSLIFVDEVDSILCSRGGADANGGSKGGTSSTNGHGTENESSNRLKTEFLIRLDGLYQEEGSSNNLPESNSNNESIADQHINSNSVIFIGATNRPHKLDEAVRRRFVKRLYIPLPEKDARLQIVTRLLKGQPNNLTTLQFEDLCGGKTDGYSGADMAELCREAALGPIRSRLTCDNIQTISLDEVGPITMEHFDAALRRVKPSVSTEDIDVYVDWNKKFGCQ